MKGAGDAFWAGYLVAMLDGEPPVRSALFAREVAEMKLERVGPLLRVKVENVTGARDAFWSALLVARLDSKGWEECVRFAHEIATLKLQVEGHVGRMIDRETIYRQLETQAERRARPGCQPAR